MQTGAEKKGRWRDAEVFYQQLHSTELPVHKCLLHEILKQKSQDRTISEKERQDARVAMESIEAQLQQIDQR